MSSTVAAFSALASATIAENLIEGLQTVLRGIRSSHSGATNSNVSEYMFVWVKKFFRRKEA
jgi:hypothetical protein